MADNGSSIEDMADNGSSIEDMADNGSSIEDMEDFMTYDYFFMEDDSFTEKRIISYLCLIVPPVLIVFGTIGNFLSIAVMCRPNLRSSNASIYLIALCLVDTCVLYTGALRHFIEEIAGIDVRHLLDLGCKIHMWLLYVSLNISVWILVAFTFERFLSVYYPHKVKIYCKRLTCILVIIGIVVFMLALNAHLVYGFENIVIRFNVTSIIMCHYMSLQYQLFDERVRPWIFFSVFNLVPFIFLMIGNSCIAAKVMQSKRNIQRIAAHGVTSNYEINMSTRSINQCGISRTTPRTDKTSSMTVVLLIISLVFLVTTTPVSLFHLLALSWWNRIDTFKEYTLWYLTYTIVNLIMYINNSVNFILYCVTGSKFRKELYSMFSKQRTCVQTATTKTAKDTESIKSPVNVVSELNTGTSRVSSSTAVLLGENIAHSTSLTLSIEDNQSSM